MTVFWRQGYEGTSLTDLTDAMGISRPSMYAAFGKKEELFRLVLDRYIAGPASYVSGALDAPTAREAAEAMLRGAVRTTTMPQDFGGCLTVQGALASSGSSAPAFEILVRWRNGISVLMEERFRRAMREGDLASDTDPARLAKYVMAVGFGIAVQAADGMGRAELDEVVDATFQGWPQDPLE